MEDEQRESLDRGNFGPRESAPPGTRQTSVDALRGLLVVAVIVGHFPRSAHGVHPFGTAPDWIYFIHVPLFMALSCLFVKPLGLGFLARRALQILVPYAAWVLLFRPGDLFRAPLALLGNLAMGNWAHLQSVLWFLPALFSLNLLMALWVRAGSSRGLAWARWALGLAGAGAFLLAPVLARRHERIPFGADVALFLLPFTLLVGLAWKHRARLGRPWLAGALLALPAGALAIRGWEPLKTHSPFLRRVDLAQFSVPETVPGYLGMCLMGVALLALFVNLKAPAWLAAVGRFSMPIYLLHYPILAWTADAVRWTGNSRWLLSLHAALILSLAVILPMVLATLALRVSPRFRWLGMAGPRPSRGPSPI
jgi:fucose 4-O-acetylase-like acetyltransferase